MPMKALGEKNIFKELVKAEGEGKVKKKES